MSRTILLLVWCSTLIGQIAALDQSCRNKDGNMKDTKKVASNAREAVDAKPNETPAPQGGRVPAGTWGGRHVSLEVTETGATVEYDCAHGSINEPLLLDRQGTFSAEGEYVVERGGPQRAGPPSESGARPARYTGSVSDKTMTLVVTLADTKEEVGRFTLTHGETPVIVKCR